MSITVEELEMLISVNYQKALQDLEKVRTKVQDVLKDIAAPMAESLRATKKQMSNVASSYTNTYKEIRQAQQKANDYSAKIMAKANAEMAKQEQSMLKDKERISKQVAEQARQRLQVERDVSEAIQRMYEREAAAKPAYIAQKPTYNSKPSKTATQILREKSTARPQAPPVEVDTGTNQQIQQMSLLQKIVAQYYAKLDYIKKILYQTGAQGKKAFDNVATATKQAATETKKLSATMQSTAKTGESVFAKLGKAIMSAFKFMVIYKALKALFSFISNGVKEAINAAEIENMFRVAFKGMSDEASKFADALKSAFGIDTMATKEMMGVFQNMITAMGIVGQNAFNMSKGMTLLANDIASLYNVDVEQASENLQSALSGQGRAVRKYGYIILDSTVKETAYRLGIAKTGEELTEKQKVLARYMTLMEQSTNAQGDMGRTLMNVANQLRILKTQITASGRAVGTAFIPFIQAALPFLNTFFIIVERVGVALSRFTFGLFGKSYDQYIKDQQAAVDGLQDMADTEDELAENAEKAGKAARGSIAGFDQLNKSQHPQDTADTGTTNAGAGDFTIPEIDIPTGQSPFEKMADAWIDKAKQIKNVLMDLGLKEVLDNFKAFWDDFSKQIAQYDFKTAIQDALLSGFKLAMSAINLAQKIVFPIAIALDIPGIVYEAINTITALFDMLDDVIRSITPGIEKFVELGLVPIAEWVGGKIKDGLKFLQELFGKIGKWFSNNTQLFTDFGEALGELAGALWEVIEPLLDTAWETFKDLVGGALDIVLDIAKGIIKTLTPALGSIAKWIKANKSTITRFLEVVLTLVLEVFAVKGIKKFFDVAVDGFKTFGTKAVDAFKSAKTSLGKFSTSLITFVASNPLAALVIAIGAVATAIGVTLYNEHKRVVDAMEKANYAKAMEGIPASADAAKAAMQGIVDKYSEMNQKSDEHKATIKTLKDEYDITSESISGAFETLKTGAGDAGTTLQTLSDDLMTLSTNLITQVETDGKYYFDTWSGVFDRTSVLSTEREQEILNNMLTANQTKKADIQSHQSEIERLTIEANDALVKDDITTYEEKQAALEEHYKALQAIRDAESERQAGIEKQKASMLAQDIIDGRKVVTEANYKQLLGELETAEKTSMDNLAEANASLRQDLTAAHESRMTQLETEGASQEERAKAAAEYWDSMKALSADYRQSQDDIASSAIANKEIIKKGLSTELTDVSNLKDKYDELQEKIELAREKANTAPNKGVYREAQDEIKDYKEQLQKLVDTNPDKFIKNWDGTFKFVANEAVTAKNTIVTAIDNSIKESATLAGVGGKETGANLASGLEDGVKSKLTDIGSTIGGMSQGILNKMADDFDMHSPSKEMAKRGRWIMEGLDDGIKDGKKGVIDELSRVFDKIKSEMDKFVKQSKRDMSEWADGLAKEIGRIKQEMGGLSAPDVNISVDSSGGGGKKFAVPQLASGGVLTRSTLVNVAEYAGAKSNPEIVAPQSIIYETSLNAATRANIPLIQLLREFMQVVRDKSTTIVMDSYEIGKAVTEHNSNMNYLLGR